MENQLNHPAEIQETPQVQTENITYAENQATKPKKSKLIYVFWGMLALLVLTIGAVSAVYFFKAVKSSSSLAPSTTPPIVTMIPTSKQNPTGTSTIPMEITGWKTAKTSFAEFKFPPAWGNMWSCGNDSYIILNNPPQESSAFPDSCPFDGTHAFTLYKSTKSYTKTSDAVPTPVNSPTTSETISEVKELLVNGKNAISWKRDVSTKPGQEQGQGNGSYFEIFILPNFSIISEYKERENVLKLLSTFKFIIQDSNSSSSSREYTFTVPTGWVKESEDSNKVVISRIENLNIEGTMQAAKSSISIYSQKLNSSTNLSTWLETRYQRGDMNLFSIAKNSVKNTSVNNSPAISIQIPGAGGYNDEGTVFIHNEIGYDISLTGINLSSSEQAYQKVLSTFNFTK